MHNGNVRYDQDLGAFLSDCSGVVCILGQDLENISEYFTKNKAKSFKNQQFR